jgi:diaminohydroxyphosphoribosylaminopyrimidine deaminase/5-amino-6-(5-phosphoribosylamino)uracil reductase
MDEDIRFMQRCLELAKLGEGRVSPNPMVGCVIVHEGKIIGEGFHARLGEAHAEVNAILSVENRELLKDSALYVSLEPCSHQGKTPPCAPLIVENQIPQVKIAMHDPNPMVSGNGIKLLEDAGIQVESGILEKEARELNRSFIWAQEKKLPYVILKWAETEESWMDRRRESFEAGPLKISSKQTDIWSHELRSKVDAILVGRRTFELDKPSLTVRHVEGKNPIRIVLDPQDSIHDFLLESKESLTLTISALSEYSSLAMKRVKLDDWSSPWALMKMLYDSGIHRLLVEGGSQTLQWFLNNGNWNEIRRIRGQKSNLLDGLEAPSIPVNANLIEVLQSSTDRIEIYRMPSGDPNL